MMLYICGIVKIVGAVLIFVIYRYEKSITATFVAFDALDESNERDKCTREFWEMFMQALEGYRGLRDINVTIVVFYHKTGKKESLHFAELEEDWKNKISERMLSLFARDWGEVRAEISGYSLDNMPDVAIGGLSGDIADSALDSTADGVPNSTTDGVPNSITGGVSKVIPKRMFIEYRGNLIYDIETGPVVGFDGFIR